MYAGVSAHVYRLTLITYSKSTFFRSSNVSSADSVDDSKRPITSSIVGFSWTGRADKLPYYDFDCLQKTHSSILSDNQDVPKTFFSLFFIAH